MQLEYRREGGQNYMVMKDVFQEGYQGRMLLENKIPGLLHMELHQMDEIGYLYYNITGKQSLRQISEAGSMDEWKIRRIISEVIGLWRSLEEYLLPQSGLWLHPDGLYIKVDNYAISACYLPFDRIPGYDDSEGGDKNFPESSTIGSGWNRNQAGDRFKPDKRQGIEPLLEYFMEIVSYQDEKAVRIVYSLYQSYRSFGEDAELLEKILLENEINTIQSSETPDRIVYKDKNNKKVNIEEKNTVFLEPGKQKWKHRVINSLICHVPLFQKTFLGKKIKKVDKTTYRGSKAEVKIITETNKNSWNTELRTEIESVHPTELLSIEENSRPTELLEERKESKWQLVSMLPEKYQDVYLRQFPFFLGSGKSETDEIIPSATVSRLHIRIDQEKESIRITDMNSTNGTFLNGLALLPNIQYLLASGDEVRLADVSYICRRAE